MKAKYENNVLRPLDKLDLMEGEEVDIELKEKSLFGLHTSGARRFMNTPTFRLGMK